MTSYGIGKILLFTALASLSNQGIAADRKLDRPSKLSPSFPLATTHEFFKGARRIVDLGGDINPLSDGKQSWTIDLAARYPKADIYVVNKMLEQLDKIRLDRAYLLNPHVARYNFFSPPINHPSGDRVVLNSPDFGGLKTRRIKAFIKMIETHLEPGGLFYAHGDRFWFVSDDKMEYTLAEELASERHRQMVGRLKSHFGDENVSEAALANYDPNEKLEALNSRYTIQLRRPKSR